MPFLRTAGTLAASFFVLFFETAIDVSAGPSSVSIEISGTIEPRCSNAGFDYPLQVKDLTAPGASTIDFDAGCNAPFQYSVQSRNGGLALEGGTAANGFDADLPYKISVHIPLTAGRVIDDSFSSRDVKAGATAFAFTNSGNAISIQKSAQMKIAWQPGAKPLAPGSYQDQLTVKLSIRP